MGNYVEGFCELSIRESRLPYIAFSTQMRGVIETLLLLCAEVWSARIRPSGSGIAALVSLKSGIASPHSFPHATLSNQNPLRITIVPSKAFGNGPKERLNPWQTGPELTPLPGMPF